MLVVETTGFRVYKKWLTGPNARFLPSTSTRNKVIRPSYVADVDSDPSLEVVLSGIPGFADGISEASDGGWMDGWMGGCARAVRYQTRASPSPHARETVFFLGANHRILCMCMCMCVCALCVCVVRALCACFVCALCALCVRFVCVLCVCVCVC